MVSGWVVRALRHLVGPGRLIARYFRHPDPKQERFFFGLLRECVDRGVVSQELLRQEISRDHVRPDALDILRRVPPLAAA